MQEHSKSGWEREGGSISNRVAFFIVATCAVLTSPSVVATTKSVKKILLFWNWKKKNRQKIRLKPPHIKNIHTWWDRDSSRTLILQDRSLIILYRKIILFLSFLSFFLSPHPGRRIDTSRESNVVRKRRFFPETFIWHFVTFSATEKSDFCSFWKEELLSDIFGAFFFCCCKLFFTSLSICRLFTQKHRLLSKHKSFVLLSVIFSKRNLLKAKRVEKNEKQVTIFLRTSLLPRHNNKEGEKRGKKKRRFLY